MNDKNLGIDFDCVSEELGGFGRFQLFVYILACLCTMCSGIFIVGPIFGSKVLPHRCKINSCDHATTQYNAAFLNFTVPWDKKIKAWDQCSRLAHRSPANRSIFPYPTLPVPSPPPSVLSCTPLDFIRSEIVQCKEWIYDTSEFRSTTNSEFNLTCDNAWLIPLESSFIMAGLLIGSLLIGMVSDKFGRKAGILTSAVFLCFGGIAGAFSPNYYFFLATRIVAGIGSMGCYQVAFVTAIEYIGPKWRTLCGILMNVPFAIGEAVLGLMAYYIRNWRNLYIANSVPVMVIFSYYWIFPESIRWLLSKNQTDEAFRMVRQIAKFNKAKLSRGTEQQFVCREVILKQSKTPPSSIFDLLKSPIIRKRSMCLFYGWMVCSLMYYGLSMYVGSFSGHLFLNFSLVILIEIPAYVSSAFASNIIGRKLLTVFSFILGGFSCIIAGFLNPEHNTVIICLSLIGKFGITAAFSAIFLYSGEIYPTAYRSIGIGACSMHGRIGGILAPFISSLAHVYKPLPSLVFGILSLAAGFLMLKLPETMGRSLPQTIVESEDLGKGESWKTFRIFGRKTAEI